MAPASHDQLHDPPATGDTNIILESPRLQFSTWESDDWKEFRKLATDPEVVRYLGTGEPWGDERIQEFVGRQQRHWRERRYCLWKLLARNSGDWIGICGLQPLPDSSEIEIGWWLTPAYWRHGLATEAATVALAYGFETCGLPRIVAIAQLENRASTRVMERIGMKFERETVHKGIPVVLYALTPKG